MNRGERTPLHAARAQYRQTVPVAQAAPALTIRCWSGMYRDQWLVVRDQDRRVLTAGGIGYCLAWVRRHGDTQRAQAAGTALSPRCRLQP